MLEVLEQSQTDPFLKYRRLSASGVYEYAAGFPDYPELFIRDIIISGLLTGHPGLLYSQLEANALHQGIKDDPLTGEQAGKSFHQYPGKNLAELGLGSGYTTYNACDTTPLTLIGTEALAHAHAGVYTKFIARRKDTVERSVRHTLSLVNRENSLYFDVPPAGVDSYHLRSTMWKDSILPHADGKQTPVYPVTYAHAHFIAARGLLSASRVLDRPSLADTADAMFRAGIDEFMRPDEFVIYQDAEGELQQASSDELHALAYIPAAYAELLPLSAIARRAEALATPYGFVCTPPAIACQLTDQYHGDTIWPFEQAMIHYGASKFGLDAVAQTAAAIHGHIGDGQEYFAVLRDGDTALGLKPGGNGFQNWSKGADEYFNGHSNLHDNPWL